MTRVFPELTELTREHPFSLPCASPPLVTCYICEFCRYFHLLPLRFVTGGKGSFSCPGPPVRNRARVHGPGRRVLRVQRRCRNRAQHHQQRHQQEDQERCAGWAR